MTLREQLSFFLAFRRWFPLGPEEQFLMYSSVTELEALIQSYDAPRPRAICLSGGMDSAVMSYLMTPDIAYTLVYPEATGESQTAQPHVRGAVFKKILVTRRRYVEALEEVISSTQQPVAPHTPLFFIMAHQAKMDGCASIVTGLGAEAHGEMAHLYAARRNLKAFQKNLYKMTADPSHVLNEYDDPTSVLSPYVNSNTGEVSVQQYLSVIGTGGDPEIAMNAAGVEAVSPLKHLRWTGQYNAQQIARGKVKPHIVQLYQTLFRREAPRKRALSAPYRAWVQDWKPSLDIFREDVQKYMKTGKRGWLIYAVERFLSGGYNGA